MLERRRLVVSIAAATTLVLGLGLLGGASVLAQTGGNQVAVPWSECLGSWRGVGHRFGGLPPATRVEFVVTALSGAQCGTFRYLDERTSGQLVDCSSSRTGGAKFSERYDRSGLLPPGTVRLKCYGSKAYLKWRGPTLSNGNLGLDVLVRADAKHARVAVATVAAIQVTQWAQDRWNHIPLDGCDRAGQCRPTSLDVVLRPLGEAGGASVATPRPVPEDIIACAQIRPAGSRAPSRTVLTLARSASSPAHLPLEPGEVLYSAMFPEDCCRGEVDIQVRLLRRTSAQSTCEALTMGPDGPPTFENCAIRGKWEPALNCRVRVVFRESPDVETEDGSGGSCEVLD